jgi:hypothetical protein
MFNALVSENSIEIISATFLSFLLSTKNLTRPYWGEITSNVITSNDAIIASQRLRSGKLSGKITFISSITYLISEILH